MNLKLIPADTGNTKTVTLNIFKTAVYPYMYREHIALSSDAKYQSGLSLCV